MPNTPIVSNNFNGGEWSDLMRGRFDLDRYSDAATTIENFLVMSEGGMVRRPSLKFITETKDNKLANLIDFEIDDNLYSVIEFTAGTFRFIRDDGIVLDANDDPYEVANPYLEEDLFRIKIHQSYDVLYLANQKYKPRTLSRYGDLDWRLEDYVFIDGPYQDENVDDSIVVTSDVYKAGNTVVLTSTQPIFSVDDIGLPWSFRELSSALNYKTWNEGESVSIGDYRKNADYLYEAVSAGTTGNTAPVHTGTPTPTLANGPFSDGTVDWTVLNDSRGWVRINEYIDEYTVKGVIQRALPPSMITDGTYKWRKPLFNNVDGWPIAMYIHNGRMVMGNDRYVAFSVDKIFNEFSPGGNPSDGFFVQISAKKRNKAYWFAASNRLIMGSSVGPWLFQTNSRDDPYTAEEPPQPKRQASIPCSYIDAIEADQDLVYVARNRQALFGMSYSIEKEGFVPNDLTQVATHVLKPGIVDIAWQFRPYGYFYGVREDGQLPILLLNTSQNIIAWSRTITDGKFKSVCTVKSPVEEVDNDLVHVCVERTINDVVKHYVERFYNHETLYENVIDRHHVDSCLEYVGEPTQIAANLGHLEGKEVSVWSKIGNFGPYLVENGQIEIEEELDEFIVGIPFKSFYEGNTLVNPNASFVMPVAFKSPVKIFAHFYETASAQFGYRHYEEEDIYDGDNKYTDSVEMFEVFPVNLDEFPLVNGIREFTMDSDTGKDIRITFTHEDGFAGPTGLLYYVANVNSGAAV